MNNALIPKDLLLPIPTGRFAFWSNNLPSWLTRTVAVGLCISVSSMAIAEERTYDLTGFDGVSAAQGIHVLVTTGDEFSVIAESDDARQLDRLELDVRRGMLRTRMDNRLLSMTRTMGWKVTVRVTVPSLVHAEASSGAELIADAMNDPALELDASSGATLRIEAIEGGSISADVSSGAEIVVAGGICSSLTADVSSGSSLDMGGVQCANVEIDASSGSDASVHAELSIDAEASSGASIQVYGTHEDITVETSSGGGIDFP